MAAKKTIAVTIPDAVGAVNDCAGHFYNAICQVCDYFEYEIGVEEQVMANMLEIKVGVIGD